MCKSNAPEVLRALDAVEEINTALRGFDELFSPDPNLSEDARDHAACLLNFLMRQHASASEKLRAVLFSRETPHAH